MRRREAFDIGNRVLSKMLAAISYALLIQRIGLRDNQKITAHQSPHYRFSKRRPMPNVLLAPNDL